MSTEKKPYVVNNNINNSTKNNNTVNNSSNFNDFGIYPKITICDSVSGIKDSTKNNNEKVRQKTRIKSFWD